MKTVQWILVITMIIIVGFFVELVKVNVNFNIEKGNGYPGFFELTPNERAVVLEELKMDNPYDYYHSHTSIGLFNYLSLNQLKLLKWVHTIVFVVIFFFLNSWMVNRVIHDTRAFKWLLVTYVSAFTFALFIYVIGQPTTKAHLFYNVSRKMIGALQSPIPTMMNWAAWKLYNQQNGTKSA